MKKGIIYSFIVITLGLITFLGLNSFDKKEKMFDNIEAVYEEGVSAKDDSITNLSTTSFYRIDFENGTSKFYDQLGVAARELTANSKLVILSNVNFNTTSPIVIGRRGLSNITIDLNGKTLKNSGSAEFLHISAHNVNFISSVPGGRIIAESSAAKSLAIRVLGE